MKTILDEYENFVHFKLKNASPDYANRYFFACIQILHGRVRMLQNRVEELEGMVYKKNGSSDDAPCLPCSFCGRPIKGQIVFTHGEQACESCCDELAGVLEYRARDTQHDDQQPSTQQALTLYPSEHEVDGT